MPLPSDEQIEFKAQLGNLKRAPLPTALALAAAYFLIQSYALIGSDFPDARLIALANIVTLVIALFTLTPYGRQQIGFESRVSLFPLCVHFAGGLAVGSLLAFALYLIFGKGNANPISGLIFIAQTDIRIGHSSQLFAFLGISVPLFTSAALAHEVCYRGILGTALAARWGRQTATFAVAAIYGISQIPLHGISHGIGGLSFRLDYAVTTCVIAVFASLLLSFTRHRRDSLIPAIALHLGAATAVHLSIYYFYLIESPIVIEG